MKLFGLIGYPLTHSFSRKFFIEKFKREGITECTYENFEIKSITDFPALLSSYPELRGINITIPYKEDIKRYLQGMDPSAEKVGAVNVVRIQTDGKLIGYNSDYYGFRMSLEKWLGSKLKNIQSLIFGSGGASKAVRVVLEDCNIPYKTVSRDETKGDYIYFELFEDPGILKDFQLIVNTTPVGMYPNVNEAPHIPYDLLNSDFYLYDLIYNPEETLFLKKGEDRGAQIKNGMEMLILQAERSWEIWNQ